MTKLLDFAQCDEPTLHLATINAETQIMPAIQTQSEADLLVVRFLRELDACQSEQARIAKVWELVHGVARAARRI